MLQYALIILNVVVLYYLFRLSRVGCACALNWKHTLITTVTAFQMLLGLASLGFQGLGFITKAEGLGIIGRPWVAAFIIVLLALGVIQIGVTYAYIRALKTKGCDCSESHIRDVWEIMNYVQLGMVLLSICLVLLLLVLLRTYLPMLMNVERALQLRG